NARESPKIGERVSMSFVDIVNLQEDDVLELHRLARAASTDRVDGSARASSRACSIKCLCRALLSAGDSDFCRSTVCALVLAGIARPLSRSAMVLSLGLDGRDGRIPYSSKIAHF